MNHFLILCLTYFVLSIGLGSCQSFSQNQTLEESLQLGSAKLARGDYKGAIQEFDVALRNDPNNPNVLVSRGLAKAQQGQLIMAIEDYTHALMENPKMHDALLYRGNAHNQLFQADQALVDFSQAIALQPGNPQALSSRAVTYYSLGQVDDAIADLQEAKLAYEKANQPNSVTQIEQLLQEYQADRN